VRRFGSRSASLEDVIAASSELAAGSGIASALLTGATAPAAAAKVAMAPGNGFWSYLDGLLADGGGQEEPREPQSPRARNGKHQNDDLTATAWCPVPLACTTPAALFLTLKPGKIAGSLPSVPSVQSSEVTVGAALFVSDGSPAVPNQEAPAAGPAVISGGSTAGPIQKGPAAVSASSGSRIFLTTVSATAQAVSSAPVLPVRQVRPMIVVATPVVSISPVSAEQTALPEQAWTADRSVRDLSATGSDPAPKINPAKGTGNALQEVPGELAFGVHLISPETRPPSSVDSPPDPGSAAAAALTSVTTPARLEPRSIPVENEHPQLHDNGISNAPAGGQTTLNSNQDTSAEDDSTPGKTRASSLSLKEPNAPPDPEQELGIAPVGSVLKSSDPARDRSPDDHTHNYPSAQTALDTVNVGVVPSTPDFEVQPTVSPAPSSVVRAPAVVPAAPAAPPASRDVSLHLTSSGSSVDIRMAEHAGEIKVTVHTPDHDLANFLRTDLPDLVGKLRQGGVQAEVWRPAGGTQSDAAHRGAADASPFQDHQSGARRDGRQKQSQQEQPNKDRSRWSGEWQSSLDPVRESHK
jgi:hypothetical protein